MEPGWQTVQAVWLARLYEPVVHGKHDVMVLGATLPAVHPRQADAPWSAYEPGRQGEHAAFATALLKLPAAHGWQAAIGTGVNDPGPHETQALNPTKL